MKKKGLAYECKNCEHTIPVSFEKNVCNKCKGLNCFKEIRSYMDKDNWPCPESYAEELCD